MLLRIKAILRRTATPAAEEKIIRRGLLSIDAERHRVTVRDEEITLTLTEFKLLITLAGRPGRMQSRERLLQDVWGYSSDADTRTVDTHITRLRSKLGDAESAYPDTRLAGQLKLVSQMIKSGS
jgi:two-component system phosphate regulon response regulator PhoB